MRGRVKAERERILITAWQTAVFGRMDGKKFARTKLEDWLRPKPNGDGGADFVGMAERMETRGMAVRVRRIAGIDSEEGE